MKERKKCLSSSELHCLLILGMGEGQNHSEKLNILKICYQQTIFISTSHKCGIYNDSKNCGSFLLKPLVYAYINILVYAEIPALPTSSSRSLTFYKMSWKFRTYAIKRVSGKTFSVTAYQHQALRKPTLSFSKTTRVSVCDYLIFKHQSQGFFNILVIS